MTTEPEKHLGVMHLEDQPEKSNVHAEPVDDDEEFTVAEQRKIIHRIDWRLLVILGFMQAVSFLDRSNLSNAAVAGMTKELKLNIGKRYSIIILVFFAPYILLQFPAQIAVRKIGPRIFLSTVVLCWGIVMICFGFVHSWTVMIPLRLLLGAFEAASFPSQFYLVSSWYSRYDLYKRTSIFYLIGVFGSATGGVLGLAFSQMNGLAGYAGWRWIFIMEGIITCLIGLSGYLFTVDFPDQAQRAWKFLTEREVAFVIRRLNRDRQDADPEKFALARFLRPALDLKIWAFAVIFFCSTMQAYSVGYYLPIILQQKLGHSQSAAQGLSTPPYVVAMLLMYAEGAISDKSRYRSPVLFLNACICINGLCVLVWAPSAGAQYFGAILVTAGCSANIPTTMVFQANNIRGTWKRAFSSASLISFGGTGGIAGSLVFRSEDAPKYLPGIYACLTANGVIILLGSILVFFFIVQNRRAGKGTTIIEGLSSFRYTL